MTDDKIRSKSLDDDTNLKYYEKIVPNTDGKKMSPTHDEFEITVGVDTQTSNIETIDDTDSTINAVLETMFNCTHKFIAVLEEQIRDAVGEVQIFLVGQNTVKIYTDKVYPNLSGKLSEINNCAWYIFYEQCTLNEHLNLCILLKLHGGGRVLHD